MKRQRSPRSGKKGKSLIRKGKQPLKTGSLASRSPRGRNKAKKRASPRIKHAKSLKSPKRSPRNKIKKRVSPRNKQGKSLISPKRKSPKSALHRPKSKKLRLKRPQLKTRSLSSPSPHSKAKERLSPRNKYKKSIISPKRSPLNRHKSKKLLKTKRSMRQKKDKHKTRSLMSPRQKKSRKRLNSPTNIFTGRKATQSAMRKRHILLLRGRTAKKKKVRFAIDQQNESSSKKRAHTLLARRDSSPASSLIQRKKKLTFKQAVDMKIKQAVAVAPKKKKTLFSTVVKSNKFQKLKMNLFGSKNKKSSASSSTASEKQNNFSRDGDMQFFKYSEKKRTLSKDSALTEITNGKICYKSSKGTLKIDIKKITKMVIGINEETPNKLTEQKPHLLLAIFAGDKTNYFVQSNENDSSIAVLMQQINEELDKMDDYDKTLSINPKEIFSKIRRDKCTQIEIITAEPTPEPSVDFEFSLPSKKVSQVSQMIDIWESAEKVVQPSGDIQSDDSLLSDSLISKSISEKEEETQQNEESEHEERLPAVLKWNDEISSDEDDDGILMEFFKYSESKRELSKKAAFMEANDGKIVYFSDKGTLKIEIEKVSQIIIGINEQTPQELIRKEPHLLLAIFVGMNKHYFVQRNRKNSSILFLMEQIKIELKNYQKELSMNPERIYAVVQMNGFAEIYIISRPQSIDIDDDDESQMETVNADALEQMREEMSLLREQNGMLRQRQSELQSSMQIIENSMHHSEEEEINHEHNKYKKLNAELCGMKSAYNELSEENAAIQQKYDDLLEESIVELEARDEQIKRVKDLQKKYQKLQNENSKKGKHIERLEKELNEHLKIDKEIKVLQTRFDKQQNELNVYKLQQDGERNVYGDIKLSKSVDDINSKKLNAELCGMKSAYNELSEENAAIQQKYDDLLEESIVESEARDKQTKRVKDLQKKYQKLQNENSKKGKHIERLEKELNEHLKLQQDGERSKRNVYEDIKLCKSVDDMGENFDIRYINEEDLRSLYAELKMDNQRIRELKETNEMSQEVQQNQQEHIESLQKKLDAVNEKYRKLDDERTKMINSLPAKHEMALKEKNEIIKEIKDETNELREELNKKNEQMMNGLNQKYKDAQNEWKRQNEFYENMIKTLRLQLEKKKEFEVNDAGEDKEKYQKLLSEQTKIIQKAQNEAKELREKLSSQNEKYEKVIGNLSTQNEESEVAPKQKQQSLEYESESSEKYEKMIDELREKYEDMEAEWKRKNESLKRELEQMNASENETHDLRKRLVAMENKYGKNNESNIFLNRIHKSLEKKLKEADENKDKHESNANDLRMRLEAMETEKEENMNKLQAKEEHIKFLEKSLESMNTEYWKLNEDNANCIKSMKTKHKEMTDKMMNEIEVKLKKNKDKNAEYLQTIKDMKAKEQQRVAEINHERNKYEEKRHQFELLQMEYESLRASLKQNVMNQNAALNKEDSKSLTLEIRDNAKGESHSPQRKEERHLYVRTEEQISDSVIINGRKTEYEKMIFANSDYVSIGSRRFYYNDIENLSGCGDSKTKWMISTRNCTIRIQSNSANARHKFMTFIQSNMWFQNS